MARFISTYSRLRPVFKKIDDDFSEIQRCATIKRKTDVAALKSIAESDTDDQDEDNVDDPFHSKITINKKTKPVKQKSSRRKPTPLKIEGTLMARRHYSPMARPSIDEDTSDEHDDSILYLSDFSEENTTLSNTDVTLTNAETCEDSDIVYSDIELPRDLPEPKRKSSTASNRILKLSQLSNKKKSLLKSHVKGSRKVNKPAHSTMLEGKFSTMNIGPFDISDISGNGPQYCSSESASSYTLMEQDSPMPADKGKKSSSKKSPGHVLLKNKKEAQTLMTGSGRSVYSLLSNESDSSLMSSPLKKKGNESKLKITGKKIALLKKSPSKEPQSQHDSISESSTKIGKKQVSFQVKDKPEVCNPVSNSITTPFNISLPHRSPVYSILKKTDEVQPSSNSAHGKPNRATSTPQKSSRLSRKAHGCHIMDLTFDVSAVTLPMDNDLVMTKTQISGVKNQNKNSGHDQKTQGLQYGEATEELVDFEPMCLQTSQNIGSLLETTPVKGSQRKQNEVTPSTQLKRHSPDAGTPSKQLPKKSRIIKPSRDGGVSNRKRLNYQEPIASGPIPDCVITTIPFTGYKLHPTTESDPPKPGHVNMNHLKRYPQDVLETILDRAFVHRKSSIRC